eukprot:3165848-Rhodomonas_salina.1
MSRQLSCAICTSTERKKKRKKKRVTVRLFALQGLCLARATQEAQRRDGGLKIVRAWCEARKSNGRSAQMKADLRCFLAIFDGFQRVQSLQVPLSVQVRRFYIQGSGRVRA